MKHVDLPVYVDYNRDHIMHMGSWNSTYKTSFYGVGHDLCSASCKMEGSGTIIIAIVIKWCKFMLGKISLGNEYINFCHWRRHNRVKIYFWSGYFYIEFKNKKK